MRRRRLCYVDACAGAGRWSAKKSWVKPADFKTLSKKDKKAVRKAARKAAKAKFKKEKRQIKRIAGRQTKRTTATSG